MIMNRFIAIIDYGVGNLLSVKKALDYLNIPSEVTDNKNKIRESSAIILPGVGAFPDAMKSLHKRGLVEVIKEESQKKPFLGICLGMQLLFDKSYEFCECDGLGLIEGEIIKLSSTELKIPHMGWNSLKILNSCPLTKGLKDGDYVYFVHSYRAKTDDKNINAYTEYGERVPALVSSGNIYGAQFHPEKSSNVGLDILKEFGELIN